MVFPHGVVRWWFLSEMNERCAVGARSCLKQASLDAVEETCFLESRLERKGEVDCEQRLTEIKENLA